VAAAAAAVNFTVHVTMGVVYISFQSK